MDTFIVKFKNRDNIEATFETEEISVSDEGVIFDEVTLYIDGKPYNGDFSSFSKNSVPEDEIFIAIINAYLRNDTEDFDYIEGWEFFDDLKQLQTYDEGLIISFPQVTIWEDEIDIYELQLATEEEKFYTFCENCMLLSKDNAILTDQEPFYGNAFIEELKEIDKGTKKILYITKYFKDNIKEILEEYEN